MWKRSLSLNIKKQQLQNQPDKTTTLCRFPGNKYYTKVAQLLFLWWVYENNSPQCKIELKHVHAVMWWVDPG